MRKNRKVFVVALVIMLVAAAVPAFAAEPMTISGVWELVESDGSKVYYYFSPGAASGTAVGVGVVPGVVEQTFPIHGTWEFAEKDEKQLFCVYQVKMFASGIWANLGVMPGQAEYRFTTENGTQKMIHNVSSENPHVFTKIGDKLTDLPELGLLGGLNQTGGRFWANNGVVVK